MQTRRFPLSGGPLRATGAVLGLGFLLAGPASAVVLSNTDFEGFATGSSVDGQGGWSSTGTWDEAVVDDGTGNTVWRVSNALTAGSFGDMPFAPRPGGVPSDTATDPVNSNPGSFAGESSTGATWNRFYSQFDFRSATGGAQDGLSITISPDNGSGARQSFVDIEDNGSGLDLVTFDVDSGGGFVGPTSIATGLDYTQWHTFGFELLFNDGPDNDVANLYLNGSLIHTGTSWEQFFSASQSAQHPLGVPVQTLLFRISGSAADNTRDAGFFFDNVSTEVSALTAVPEPASLSLAGLALAGLVAQRRQRRVRVSRGIHPPV